MDCCVSVCDVFQCCVCYEETTAAYCMWLHTLHHEDQRMPIWESTLLLLMRTGGKDTVCPTGGGVGQSLSADIPARSPPAPSTPPTSPSPSLVGSAIQIACKSRSVTVDVCVRERKERGWEKCSCIPGERERERDPCPFLLLPPPSSLPSWSPSRRRQRGISNPGCRCREHGCRVKETLVVRREVRIRKEFGVCSRTIRVVKLLNFKKVYFFFFGVTSVWWLWVPNAHSGPAGQRCF